MRSNTCVVGFGEIVTDNVDVAVPVVMSATRYVTTRFPVQPSAGVNTIVLAVLLAANVPTPAIFTEEANELFVGF